MTVRRRLSPDEAAAVIECIVYTSDTIPLPVVRQLALVCRGLRGDVYNPQEPIPHGQSEEEQGPSSIPTGGSNAHPR